MHMMSDDERRVFLMSGTRTGHLATVRDDGRPHVAPVWFVLDGDDIVFTTGVDTVKGRNLRRDPRAAMSVDDPVPDYSFVHVTGTVELTDPADDFDTVWRFALQISGRYMGADRAEEFAGRNAVPSEMLVRLTPVHTFAQADLAD